MEPVREIRFKRINEIEGLGMVRAEGANQRIGRHAHDSLCFGPILSGVREIVCCGRVFQAKAGQVVVINPGEVHALGAGAVEHGYVMFSLERRAAEQALSLAPGAKDFPYFKELAIDDPKLFAMLLELAESLDGLGGSMGRQSRFMTVLSRLVTLHGGFRDGEETDAPEAIARCAAHLEDNFQQNVALDELSGLAGVSPYHLTRLFTRHMGLPPHEYLNAVRIQRAKKLLAAGVQVVDAALETGFVDQSHFSRRFRQVVGMTPGRYAKGFY